MEHNALQVSIKQAMALTNAANATQVDAVSEVAYAAEWVAMGIPANGPTELAYKLATFADWIADMSNEDLGNFNGFPEAAASIAADLIRIFAVVTP